MGGRDVERRLLRLVFPAPSNRSTCNGSRSPAVPGCRFGPRLCRGSMQAQSLHPKWLVLGFLVQRARKSLCHSPTKRSKPSRGAAAPVTAAGAAKSRF